MRPRLARLWKRSKELIHSLIAQLDLGSFPLEPHTTVLKEKKVQGKANFIRITGTAVRDETKDQEKVKARSTLPAVLMCPKGIVEPSVRTVQERGQRSWGGIGSRVEKGGGIVPRERRTSGMPSETRSSDGSSKAGPIKHLKKKYERRVFYSIDFPRGGGTEALSRGAFSTGTLLSSAEKKRERRYRISGETKSGNGVIARPRGARLFGEAHLDDTEEKT